VGDVDCFSTLLSVDIRIILIFRDMNIKNHEKINNNIEYSYIDSFICSCNYIYIMNNLFVKKLKAYEREALLPLYYEHATYLLRVIKTADIIDSIYAKIDTYIEVATCHEIAINSLSDLELETHQNRLGKEAEYTNHEKAKNVGRDLRVRLIWTIIKNEIESDPSLSKYETYKDLTDIPDGRVFCPICGQVICEYQYEKIVDGEHDDGTLDYHYTIVNCDQTPCDHLLMNDNECQNVYYDSNFEYILKNLKKWGVYLSDFEKLINQNSYDVSFISESDCHFDSNGQDQINYFSKDPEKLIRLLNWFYAEKCLEYNEEFEYIL